jgi:cell division protein FtsI (penicillin-binding protein 3)
VVIDDPKVGSYYGTAVSAPVFTEVAQEVLEYLGVPHDEAIQPSKAKTELLRASREDDHDETGEDINALYAAVNDLPNDDPLKAQADSAGAPASTDTAVAAGLGSANPASAAPAAPQPLPNAAPASLRAAASGTAQGSTAPRASSPSEVVVQSAKQVKVPSFVGMSMRQVIETAAGAGLEVEVAGRGSVREQAPAAGSLVPPGTKVVVRGGR